MGLSLVRERVEGQREGAERIKEAFLRSTDDDVRCQEEEEGGGGGAS